MPHVLTVQGKLETIFDDEQFARMLDERLGYDAGEYFRDALKEAKQNPDVETCCGECDRVYEMQEHWENVVRDACDEMGAWPIRRLTKDELMDRRDNLLEQLRGEL